MYLLTGNPKAILLKEVLFSYCILLEVVNLLAEEFNEVVNKNEYSLFVKVEDLEVYNIRIVIHY